MVFFDLNSKPRTFISCGVVNKLEPGEMIIMILVVIVVEMMI